MFSTDESRKRTGRHQVGIKENNMISLIQIQVSKLGWRLFRNSTGTAWQGKATTIKETGPYFVKKGSVILEDPRFLEYGLVKGGSDLIGWKPVVITQEMVGQTIAQFTAREVKSPNGRPTAEQLNFVARLNAAGGDGKVVYSVGESV
jgi:hypothetical protein